MTNPAPDALAALAELVAWADMSDADPGNCDLSIGERAWANARAALLRDQGEVAALREERNRYRMAIIWALGESDPFRSGDPHEGKYYWRAELRERAGLVEPPEGK